MSNPEMQIPFDGFYHSRWSDSLDFEEESEAYNENEEHGTDESDYAQLSYEKTEYGKAFDFIAEEYVKHFVNKLDELLGVSSGCVFTKMESPREYNFTTDRLFVTVNDATMKNIWRQTKRKKLEKLIKERCTSRSGFISFYSNDLKEWVKKPIKNWDHNERGILLEAFLASADTSGDEIQEEIQEYFSGNDVFGQALWKGRDEQQFEAAIAAIRPKKD